MIYELDITYDPQEAFDYFEGLKKNYSHLMWDHVKHHNDPKVIDPKNSVNGVYGWGLQTIFNDIDFPFHADIDPHDEGPEAFKNTKLVYGFVERLFNKFIKPYRSFIMSFPAGGYIGPWLPSGPKHVKIIVPIVSNEKFKFVEYTDVEVTKENIQPGTILMLDFTNKISQHNNGSTEIVGITFNVPYEYKERLLGLSGKI